MNLITLDFETYYDTEYSLSRLTTEAYVRDPRFECIMVGLKVNDGTTYTVVGEDVTDALHDVDIPNNALLCHHSHFDGLILSHRYGLKPKIWFDTLPMGRAEVGSASAKGISLGALRLHFGMAPKGEEVVLSRGKHLADFTPQELQNYRRYCGEDVDGTYDIFNLLRPAFSASELKLIDLTTRLFTEPMLELDTELLKEYKDLVLRNKEYLMLRAGVDRTELTSNNKFAEVLRRFGVEPGMKDSATAKMPDGTPKKTFAFAKTDQFMADLLEHEDEAVQILAEARLGVKTSIAETRAQRFIDMGLNGPACVYLKYWGAEQTGRHGGGDKCNWQNLGRVANLEDHHRASGLSMFTAKGRAEILDPGIPGLTGIAAKEFGIIPEHKCHRIGLRDTVKAPEGHVLVVGDSANIEARMVCWIANQSDILEKYRAGEDLYCDMASDIYSCVVTKKDGSKRQLGKVAVLGLGFGMGKKKFYATATKPPWGVVIEEAVTNRAVEVFRHKYDKVAAFWEYQNEIVIPSMADGGMCYADPLGKIMVGTEQLILPNGRVLRYPNLRQRKNPDPDSYFKVEWVFDVREGSRLIPTKLYGGKLCIAAGTKVLTNLGWVNIENITVKHLVHDGVNFISHGGIIYKSVQECIPVDGVLMTPEHEVLTDEGWKAALEKPRPYRPNLRGTHSIANIQKRREENVQVNAVLPVEPRIASCPVYDIMNCGPRQRFVVQGREAPFIVHNCENIVQALARIVVMDQAVIISRRYKVVMLVHDEVVCCVPVEQAEECKAYMLEVMRTVPEWAEGLPLDAEAGIDQIYSLAK